MLPDPEALIRRSGAAAPLLNAVRARDTVRSVIDRLTGNPSAGAAIPAAEPAPAPAAQKPE
jgi:AsmA protein